ncbi:MAG: YbaB/EbfC family nucleoid-associated protein [Planctomycetaceae bacterium]|nr:YbaB/EbfC family nucleoid-associated protein [Planctomycetaceae bacterium]
MFDNIKSLGALMKNAGEIKQKAAELQEQLERQTVEGESGGGAVRVTMNGKGHVLRVQLDQPLLVGIAGDDKEIVEELIAAAVNGATARMHQLVAEEMQKVTGGLNIPGLTDALGSGQIESTT